MILYYILANPSIYFTRDSLPASGQKQWTVNDRPLVCKLLKDSWPQICKIFTESRSLTSNINNYRWWGLTTQPPKMTTSSVKIRSYRNFYSDTCISTFYFSQSFLLTNDMEFSPELFSVFNVISLFWAMIFILVVKIFKLIRHTTLKCNLINLLFSSRWST